VTVYDDYNLDLVEERLQEIDEVRGWTVNEDEDEDDEDDEEDEEDEEEDG
jgi:hypothetical protein